MEMDINLRKKLIAVHEEMGWSSWPAVIHEIDNGRLYYTIVTTEGRKHETSIDMRHINSR